MCGETGSGKTTQLPKICLALKRGAAGLIGCTQPRRIAASSLASRLAQELPGMPRGFVGHKIRFQDRTGPDTVVKVMTDGILLAETHSDRELRAYDTIIVDEAHERSLNIDFLLGYLKRLVRARPELKVIVTSATIDTQRFSDFFDGAPVIEVSGRTYPVEVRYRPEFFEVEDEDDEPVDMNEAIAKAVDEIAAGQPHRRHPRLPAGRARDPRGRRGAAQAPPQGRRDPAALLAPVGRGTGPRLRARPRTGASCSRPTWPRPRSRCPASTT